jgi:hypothetical protein
MKGGVDEQVHVIQAKGPSTLTLTLRPSRSNSQA